MGITIEEIYEHRENAYRSSDLVRTGLPTVRKYSSFICPDLPIEISLEKTSYIVEESACDSLRGFAGQP